MKLSLKEFREKFINDLLEIHWRHWTTLGVASHVRPERYWIVDLEAITTSTLLIGLCDKRLLSVSLEWLIKNGERVNHSRLKRIGKVFMKPFPGSNEPLLAPEVLKLTANTLKKFGQNALPIKGSNSSESNETRVREYEGFFNKFQMKGIVTEPQIQQPSLVQLLLRNVFGVDARVEVLIYLIINDSGNSNSIAKDVFYDQKNVYRILEKWTKAEVVTKITGKRVGEYSLKRKNEWLDVLGLKEKPGYLNWVRTLLVLNQLAKALSTPPWSDDEYLISSFFRDILNEAKSIGRSLNIMLPEPVSFSGSQYFAPFAMAVLDILKRLRVHKK